MTADPRIVKVNCARIQVTVYPRNQHARYLVSSTLISGVVHACRESQNHGLYQKVFPNLPFIKEYPQNLDRCYIWVNFDVDMVNIGETHLRVFKSVTHLAKRLRFMRDTSAEFWMGEESTYFTTLKMGKRFI